MKKTMILIALIAWMITGFSLTTQAEITISPEVDVQLLRLYEGEIFGQDLEVERQARTYLLGTDLKLGNLSLRLKSGVIDSELEVAEAVELKNDLGMAAGIDVDYGLAKVYGASLSLIGSYLYSRAEIDEATIIATGQVIGNPLRNALTTHSYEAGVKITAGDLPIPIKPYIAAVYSDSTINLSTDDVPFINLDVNADAAKNFGLRLGTEGSPLKNLSVKIEGALIDQEAIMFSGSYRF